MEADSFVPQQEGGEVETSQWSSFEDRENSCRTHSGTLCRMRHIWQLFVGLFKDCILRDPGADNGGEGKSQWAGKYDTKKSKERREEPLGTMSYQISSKRSPPFWLLIGQKNTKVFWHQSEVRTAATVWNRSGKTLSPGVLVAVLYFSLCHIFPPV